MTVAAGTKLFGRRANVIVDTLLVSNLRVKFKVSKQLHRAANTAEIRIYNLTPEHRTQLEEKTNVVVALEAGFDGALSQLYLGQLRTARPEREGADIVMRLASADGEKAMQTARVNQSFGAGTPVTSVLDHVVGSLGVNLGNASRALVNRTLGGSGMRTFSSGTVVSGNSARELDRLLVPAGLEWSIQDGIVQILERGRALNTEAVVLSSSSGLIGAPSLSPEGVVKGRCFIMPDVVPGRIVRVEGEFLQGFYRIDKTDVNGDTRGGDWFIDFEGKAPRHG